MRSKIEDKGDVYCHPQIVETMPITEEVSTFLKTMGPFFEAVNEPLPVPEEEKWRFYDGSPPDSAPPINGTPHPQGNGPVNGDMHTGKMHLSSVACSVLRFRH